MENSLFHLQYDLSALRCYHHDVVSACLDVLKKIAMTRVATAHCMHTLTMLGERRGGGGVVRFRSKDFPLNGGNLFLVPSFAYFSLRLSLPCTTLCQSTSFFSLRGRENIWPHAQEFKSRKWWKTSSGHRRERESSRKILRGCDDATGSLYNALHCYAADLQGLEGVNGEF